VARRDPGWRRRIGRPVRPERRTRDASRLDSGAPRARGRRIPQTELGTGAPVDAGASESTAAVDSPQRRIRRVRCAFDGILTDARRAADVPGCGIRSLRACYQAREPEMGRVDDSRATERWLGVARF
jgi:hypothetical protein